MSDTLTLQSPEVRPVTGTATSRLGQNVRQGIERILFSSLPKVMRKPLSDTKVGVLKDEIFWCHGLVYREAFGDDSVRQQLRDDHPQNNFSHLMQNNPRDCPQPDRKYGSAHRLDERQGWN
jgi:hypothetical protein